MNRSPGFVQKQPQDLFCKKKVFLKISQILQENTCVGASFRPAALLKGDSNTSVFLWNLQNF